MRDYELLKEELGWYQGHTDWLKLLEIFVDLGYQGIDKDFEVSKLNIPFKKPRKSNL